MGIPHQGLNIGNMIKGGMEMGKAVNGRYIFIKKMSSLMSFLHTQAIEKKPLILNQCEVVMKPSYEFIWINRCGVIVIMIMH